jgi:hypothetical protein
MIPIQAVYESLEEIQKDLDEYMMVYNIKRTHQGRNMNGRTPIQVFEAGLVIENDKFYLLNIL